MTHANRFEIAYLRLASTAAVSLSKDPVTKVGSVISTPDFRQFSLGYNGFATGIAETPERWEKPNKYNFVIDRKSTRLNSSHEWISRMPSSA